MKFLPNFEGVRLTLLFALIFLTKYVLYLLSHSSILINIFASTIFNNTKALKAFFLDLPI